MLRCGVAIAVVGFGSSLVVDEDAGTSGLFVVAEDVGGGVSWWSVVETDEGEVSILSILVCAVAFSDKEDEDAGESVDRL